MNQKNFEKRKNGVELRSHKLFPWEKPVGHELSGSDGYRLVSHVSENFKNPIVKLIIIYENKIKWRLLPYIMKP